MTPMTDERLREIEERCEKATKGPWTWDPDFGVTPAKYEYEARTSRNIVEIDSGFYPPWGGDGPFIAHSRTDVPDLLAEVRALRKVAKAGLDCWHYYGGDQHSGPIKRMRAALEDAGWLEREGG